jgi:cytochrome c553
MSLANIHRSRLARLALGVGVVGFLILQCVRPPLTHPPVTADLQAPADVKAILVASCYDCHSNETKLKWFDYIQPGYWLVVHDVNEGREHLNFSEIGAKPVAEQNATLFEALSQIELGAMPPKKYTALHPEAVVTPEQIATLKKYLGTLETAPLATPEQTAATDAQYAQWLQSASAPRPTVQPEFNGLEFPADYKDWRTISTTVRDDNGTLRVIVGNDVAIQAVKSGQINPWPDGTMFAKIAWYQSIDASGNVTAGAFKQVEFMEKDSQKYARTAGWGWGRWLGTELKPYGKSASFTSSCVSCHAPLRDSDFVFTFPIRTQPKETP